MLVCSDIFSSDYTGSRARQEWLGVSGAVMGCLSVSCLYSPG